jgi:hypothetical protein
MAGARLSTKHAVLWIVVAAAVSCAATLWWIRPERNSSLVPLFLALEILSGGGVIAISALLLFRLVRSRVKGLIGTDDIPWRIGLSLLLTMILGNAAVLGLFGLSVSVGRLVLTNVGLLGAWIVAQLFVRSRRHHNTEG